MSPRCYGFWVNGQLTTSAGGAAVGSTERPKGTDIMAVADRSGPRIAPPIESASSDEVTLVGDTVTTGFVWHLPSG